MIESEEKNTHKGKERTEIHALLWVLFFERNARAGNLQNLAYILFDLKGITLMN